jgi:hypothetical protein
MSQEEIDEAEAKAALARKVRLKNGMRVDPEAAPLFQKDVSIPRGAGIEVTVRKDRSKNVVYKVPIESSFEKRAKHDIPILRRLGKLAPETWADPKHRVIVQRYIHGKEIGQYYADKLFGGDEDKGEQFYNEKIRPKLEKKIEALGLEPIDLHYGNVMVDKKGKMYIVDVGFFNWLGKEPDVNMRQLQRRMKA